MCVCVCVCYVCVCVRVCEWMCWFCTLDVLEFHAIIDVYFFSALWQICRLYTQKFPELIFKTYLQAVSQKGQTVLAKLELPHFIETAFEHSWQATPRFRK